MDKDQLLCLFDQEVRINFASPLTHKEVLEHIVRYTRPSPGTNFVAYCHCSEKQLDAVIQEQVNCLRGLNQPFGWKVYEHDRPASLREHLLAHGFVLENVDALMVLDLQAVPDSLLASPTADVRRVNGQEQQRDLCTVMTTIWGGSFENRLTLLNLDLQVPGYASHYVGYADGLPACAGRINYYPGGHFAELKSGSTLPEHRGRGLYTAVLAARAQEAVQRGYRYLTIEASTMSAPIVARHGFQFIEDVFEYKWQGGK